MGVEGRLVGVQKGVIQSSGSGVVYHACILSRTTDGFHGQIPASLQADRMVCLLNVLVLTAWNSAQNATLSILAGAKSATSFIAVL